MTITQTDQRHTNRLINETSPYLLQHAHNPVDWYPWGPEALARARDEQRLILLSIGYSACHWCHVMERESFENEKIAALMNEHFVNVKVDREERPDLDDIYMAATVAMNSGQGGWPMTVFLTPTLEPVFAGTYYPPDDRYGRPGFPRLLAALGKAWQTDRGDIVKQAKHFTEQLRAPRTSDEEIQVGVDQIRLAGEQFGRDFDTRYGGFGTAPKFPPAVSIMLLLRLYHRTGQDRFIEMASRTLDGMANGGMYDHIGGGFCRYSTDEKWLVPHFEKMLYDNALLCRAYLEGFQVTNKTSFARVAREILDYVLREMTADTGGFFSSTDADSEGVEGKFFVWQPDQIDELFPESDREIFKLFYDITPEGNWEGNSIPHTPHDIEAVAKRFDVKPDELQKRLDGMRQVVFDAREQRIHPGLDDKILTAWNGLMIGAFAEGYRVLNDERYMTAACRAADFVLNELTDDEGHLLRTHRNGRSHLQAYLEDYAYLAEGLLDLYEVTGIDRYFTEAVRLADSMVNRFHDKKSAAFFHTSDTHEELLFRFREGADGATPAPNAVAAHVLVRLASHLQRDEWRTVAANAIHAYGSSIGQYPRAFSKSMMVVDWLTEPPVELAFVGDPNSDEMQALRRAAASVFVPHKIQAIGTSGPETTDIPLLAGKNTVDGRAALYICQNFACQAPIVDPDEVPVALASTDRAPARGSQ